MQAILNPDPVKSKRPRALPRVWKRFYQLERGETFTSPNPINRLLSKRGFFTAEDTEGAWVHYLPWTRVRTTTLVRDVLPGGKSSKMYPVDPAVASYPTIPFKGGHDIMPEKLTLGATSGPSA